MSKSRQTRLEPVGGQEGGHENARIAALPGSLQSVRVGSGGNLQMKICMAVLVMGVALSGCASQPSTASLNYARADGRTTDEAQAKSHWRNAKAKVPDPLTIRSTREALSRGSVQPFRDPQKKTP